MDFIAAIVTVEAFGDWQLAQYATKGLQSALFLGYASYAILLGFFIKSIRTMGLAWSNSAWDGWSNLATSAVAIFVMKEKPNPKELCGIALISGGLLLLGTDGTRNTKGA